MKLYKLLIVAFCILFSACNDNNKSSVERKAVYVKPSIDKKGRYREGHIRMPVSAKKDVIKNLNRSKYYYQTKGKYKRKKKLMEFVDYSPYFFFNKNFDKCD